MKYAETKKMVEGIDYKLIYSGSKYFWRTKIDVEFHLYHHTLAHTLEIIPFDIAKSKELPRLYLDSYAMEIFVKDDTMKKVQEKITASTQGGKYSVNMSAADKASLLEDTKRVLLASHVMARLQETGTPPNTLIAYMPASGDAEAKVVVEPNAALVPVPVMRRRRTTNEEIAGKLNDLALDQAKLAAATNRAQKMADLMQGSVSGFVDSVKKKKAWLATRTKWAQKWAWAIDRILIQNAVGRYTSQLLAYEEKLKASPNKLARKTMAKEI